jgi:hypothetical protein
MVKNVKDYYGDEDQARYVQTRRIFELEDKKELLKR